MASPWGRQQWWGRGEASKPRVRHEASDPRTALPLGPTSSRRHCHITGNTKLPARKSWENYRQGSNMSPVGLNCSWMTRARVSPILCRQPGPALDPHKSSALCGAEPRHSRLLLASVSPLVHKLPTPPGSASLVTPGPTTLPSTRCC